MIISFTGPSGTGKTTLAFRLLENFPQTARLLTSYTTRSPRHNDIRVGNHEEYHYLSTEAFTQMHREDQFEWTDDVRDYYYGTTRASLDHAVATLNQLWIMILTVSTLPKFYKAMERRNASSAACSIFIRPPHTAVLKERLASRNLTEEAMRNEIARFADWERQAMTLNLPLHYVMDTNNLIDVKYREVLGIISKIKESHRIRTVS